MRTIENILETQEVFDFLSERWLLKQYKKAKTYLLAGIYGKSDFKLRKPKEKWEWSFRINKQFRAFWKLEDTTLIIYIIDNHQNY